MLNELEVEKLDLILENQARMETKVNEVDEALLGTYDKKGFISRLRSVENTLKLIIAAIGTIALPVITHLVLLLIP